MLQYRSFVRGLSAPSSRTCLSLRGNERACRALEIPVTAGDGDAEPGLEFWRFESRSQS